MPMTPKIHIEDIPAGASLQIVKTKDTLYPEVSSSEFVTSFKYKGKEVYWNDRNSPRFYTVKDGVAKFSYTKIK